MPRLSTFTPEVIPKEFFQQLQSLKIKSVEELIATPIHEILNKTKINEKEFKEIRKKILIFYSEKGVSGDEFVSSHQKNLQVYKTGSSDIDNLLSSGVYTNQILEISGPSFSGKTQFCLTQTLFVSAKTKGTVIYIDTNNSFSDSRLRELHTETKNKDPEIIPFLVTLRDKIKVFKLYEIDTLLSVLEEIHQKIENGKDNFYSNLRMIVIDSINVILGPLSVHSKFFILMGQLSTSMKSLANDYDVAVIVTNNSVLDYEGDKKFKPALGETWKHIANTQLFFEYQIHQDSSIDRKATLTKSPATNGYEKSCKFKIEKIGIVDYTYED